MIRACSSARVLPAAWFKLPIIETRVLIDPPKCPPLEPTYMSQVTLPPQCHAEMGDTGEPGLVVHQGWSAVKRPR